MILSSQIQAIRQWVADATTGVIVEGVPLEPIPLDRIVWSKQDYPDRGYPYALVFYTGSVEEGISPAQWIDGNDDQVTRTGDDTGISITIVNKQDDAAPDLVQLASSYIRELKARLRNFTAEPLRLAELAVRDVNAVPDVGRLQGRSQWESRGVLDITFGHAVTVTASPGIIEHAEVTGTTTPPTPSAPQNIPAP